MVLEHLRGIFPYFRIIDTANNKGRHESVMIDEL